MLMSVITAQMIVGVDKSMVDVLDTYFHSL